MAIVIRARIRPEWALLLALLVLPPSCKGGGSQSKPKTPLPDSPWVWESGNPNCNVGGAYGSLGVADPANYPGGRMYATSWKDGSGNFWIFGGITIVGWGPIGYLSDLWKFDGTNWTWVAGPSDPYTGGVWGTLGIADPANIPSGRGGSGFGQGPGGDVWLFGGTGVRDAGNTSNNKGLLSDLWKFDGTNWTWMSGPNQLNQGGTYGTQGVPDAANVPGARTNPAGWVDASGNFWLFGGSDLSVSWSDLWKFDGTNWTWVAGPNTTEAAGVYGTKGVASAANSPGARWAPACWTDGSGNLWLFGGAGLDSAGAYGDLSDLWKFDGTNWTWVSGSNTANPIPDYGTLGVPASSNQPPGRTAACGAMDGSGNIWTFGGSYSSDLWRFDGVNWTWMGGPTTSNQKGVYGTLGVPGPGQAPGGRHGASIWITGSGSPWIFGGYGRDLAGTLGMMTDLWSFTPP